MSMHIQSEKGCRVKASEYAYILLGAVRQFGDFELCVRDHGIKTSDKKPVFRRIVGVPKKEHVNFEQIMLEGIDSKEKETIYSIETI